MTKSEDWEQFSAYRPMIEDAIRRGRILERENVEDWILTEEWAWGAIKHITEHQEDMTQFELTRYLQQRIVDWIGKLSEPN